MSNNYKFDVVIVGSGMVGMSLAYQLNKKFPKFKICILEKEFNVGMHSSGRNSGVLHAGIYYPPNTLKAKVCVEGANRLKNWIVENKIKILNCGKIIIPQRESLDPQLDVLMERGLKNGAEVEIINEVQIKKIFPEANITSGRGLWSPNTSVVDPKEIMTVLKNQLEQRNVKFFFKAEIKKVDSLKSIVELNISNEIKSKKCLIHYGHLFNCAGLQSDKVAKLYGVALNYKILPFKGLYWDLKSTAPFKINTNLYPVPDLSMPFLGIHATPTINGNGTFGPTAIPAFGIENYKTFENIEALNSVKFFRDLFEQFILNKNNFRRYAFNQALLGIKPLFLKSLQEIIPSVRNEHLALSSKVGIRSQLFDNKSKILVNDFVVEEYLNSTHILNAISPAFTSSFALADLIIEKNKIFS